jgi:2',3'-cyclic-nucleotide 2'-phosphodiesterase (5'-nucleotidase family)
LDQPLAVLDAPLDSRQEVTRGAESSLGDVVADALRVATGADLALVNGGGLRGNRVYGAGSALTRGDLLREMPFGNLAVVLEVSGEQVRAALEHGVSKAPALSGRFPQVSGLSFTYNPAAAPGRRVGSITIGGKALDPAARYRLATSDYLAGGGDGYAMLSGAKALGTREAAPLLANTVMEQVQRLGRIAVTPGSRIRIP